MAKKDIFGLFAEASKFEDSLTFFSPKSSQEASYWFKILSHSKERFEVFPFHYFGLSQKNRTKLVLK